MRGPESSGSLRFPDYVTSALESGWLSALRTGRLYPQQYPGTYFKRLSRPRAHEIVGCDEKKSPVTPSGIDPGNFFSFQTYCKMGCHIPKRPKNKKTNYKLKRLLPIIKLRV
jgi:hypothetical protein